MLEFVDKNIVQRMWLQQNDARPVRDFLNLTYPRQ